MEKENYSALKMIHENRWKDGLISSDENSDEEQPQLSEIEKEDDTELRTIHENMSKNDELITDDENSDDDKDEGEEIDDDSHIPISTSSILRKGTIATSICLVVVLGTFCLYKYFIATSDKESGSEDERTSSSNEASEKS